jgi:hypothetical protein
MHFQPRGGSPPCGEAADEAVPQPAAKRMSGGMDKPNAESAARGLQIAGRPGVPRPVVRTGCTRVEARNRARAEASEGSEAEVLIGDHRTLPGPNGHVRSCMRIWKCAPREPAAMAFEKLAAATERVAPPPDGEGEHVSPVGIPSRGDWGSVDGVVGYFCGVDSAWQWIGASLETAHGGSNPPPNHRSGLE